MIVAVKLPNKLNERVLSFPFLHALDAELSRIASEDPDDDTYQIHLISAKDGVDVLNLLPFHAFYHEVPMEDLKTVFTAHRACKSFSLTNQVDLFISTTTGFVDASFGKNIGATKRAGFGIGKNKWFLNQVVDHPGNIHKSDEIFKLLKTLTDKKIEVPNVYARKIDEIYLDWRENPYTVIDLDLIEEEINPEWPEIFELVTNKRFVFMCSALGEYTQKDKVQDFIKTLPGKNTYKFFQYDSNIELAKLIAHSIAFVTSNSDLVQFSSYCGAYTFYINLIDNMKLLGSKYFKGEVKEFDFKGGKSLSFNLLFDELIQLIEEKSAQEGEDPAES